MKKLVIAIVLAGCVHLPAFAQAAASSQTKAAVSQLLYDAEGKRVGRVYRINAEGSPQIIVDGRLITVSSSTLSEADGKLTTSLTRKQISARR